MIIKLKGSNIFSGLGNISELGKPYSVTVTCSTPGVTITITATGMTTVTSTSGSAMMENIPYATRAYYTVSAEGYNTKEGSTVSGGTIPVTLTAVSTPTQPTTYTFTINPTPSDATVTLTASGYTQSGNSITVPSGTSVAWKVSATGYTEKTGTHTVTKTESKSVALSATGGAGEDNISVQFSTVANTYLNLSNGEPVTSGQYGAWLATDFIPVTENETYSFTACTDAGSGAGSGAALVFYNASKEFIKVQYGTFDTTENGQIFLIPSGVSYIRIGTIKAKREISLIKNPSSDEPITIEWIDNYYVSRENSTTGKSDGEIVSATGWAVTDYVSTDLCKTFKFNATIPAAGVTSVYCVYGYDSNKNPIMPILTPGDNFNVFEDYLIEIEDENIAYIVACAHKKTAIPTLEYVL